MTEEHRKRKPGRQRHGSLPLPDFSGPTTSKKELEYRIPRLHSPVNSRRFPEIFGDLCKNKTSFL